MLKQRTIEGLRNQFNELSRSSIWKQRDENEELTEIDKYLTLLEIEPTTPSSVPSEYLFSDAGNHIL
ncbi:6359_t:CDS:2, partial [Dentiscutata erythropus]